GDDVCCRNERNPECRDALASLVEGAVHADATAGILDDHGGKPDAARVLHGIAHAEIERETSEEGTLEPALPQIAAEPRWRRAVVLEKDGIGIDFLVIALPDDQLGVRNV